MFCSPAHIFESLENGLMARSLFLGFPPKRPGFYDVVLEDFHQSEQLYEGAKWAVPYGGFLSHGGSTIQIRPFEY
jgi:hypothetical protein